MPTFHLQIVTPDGGFYDGQAEKLIVRAWEGTYASFPVTPPM